MVKDVIRLLCEMTSCSRAIKNWAQFQITKGFKNKISWLDTTYINLQNTNISFYQALSQKFVVYTTVGSNFHQDFFLLVQKGLLRLTSSMYVSIQENKYIFVRNFFSLSVC